LDNYFLSLIDERHQPDFFFLFSLGAVLRRVLELLTRHCPGLLEAQVQLARCAYLAGNMDAAQRKAADCLRLNQGCSDAHLLTAHIFLLQNRPGVRLRPDQCLPSKYTFCSKERTLFGLALFLHRITSFLFCCALTSNFYSKCCIVCGLCRRRL
jgi:hypothetical protein